jgi:hypothetical protein
MYIKVIASTKCYEILHEQTFQFHKKKKYIYIITYGSEITNMAYKAICHTLIIIYMG